MNPFLYSKDNKRYKSLAYENSLQGTKTYKAVIDAGLSCPNIDGTKGTGGCIYCDGGSGYFTALPTVPIEKQPLSILLLTSASKMKVSFGQGEKPSVSFILQKYWQRNDRSVQSQ